jgi:endonuclease/exonuclease/phosphatase family metal-dependent hydrolase
MTWNIHAGTDARGAPNLDRVAAVIRAEKPDIVLLQEVDSVTRRSSGVDQLATLAEATGMHRAFGRSLDFQGGGYGIAILSRTPIVASRTVRLLVEPPQQRSGGVYEPRSALHSRVVWGGDTLEVVNTHIDASGDDFYRLQEIRRVLRVAGALRDISGIVVFGGDLNAEPESEVQRLVREDGWRDVWTTCGGEGPGLTYPDSAAVKRIDYLYLDAGWRCRGARVTRTGASDHALLVVELSR